MTQYENNIILINNYKGITYLLKSLCQKNWDRTDFSFKKNKVNVTCLFKKIKLKLQDKEET